MIFSSNALQNRHILITGASGEIGAEIARVTAAMGAAVSLTGRDEQKLSSLAAELSETGASVFFAAANLENSEERLSLVEACEEKLGFISGLVNCAGIAGGSVLDDLEEAFVEHMLDVNVTAAMMLTQLVYLKMKIKKKGRIVNVSSLSGVRGTYGNSAYAASKFALRGFTQSLAVEAAPHGIAVNAVCPGYVNTKMAKRAIERKAEQSGITFAEQWEKVLQGLPSGRVTEPLEVAYTIAFLLTDATKNIMGESFFLSGASVMK